MQFEYILPAEDYRMPSNIGNVERIDRQTESAQPLTIQSNKPLKDQLQTTGGVTIETTSNKEGQGKAEGSNELSPEETVRLMDNLNQVLSIFDIEARVTVDRQTQMKVIQLRDNKTQTLIRQVPSDEFLLRVAQSRNLIGLVIDQIA
jgi:uncharacterized FlaG/YvyC family protein